MTRTLVLALCVLVLAGCQLYWMKPNADMSRFTADHQACVQSSGSPMGGEGRVLVNLKVYRGCLRERGWSRETGSSYANPPGYFRGLEDEGPVRVSDVPEQIPSRNLPGRSR
jgi:hypothetical protein